MTHEELLLKDLCARLPYGVICHYDVIVPMVGKVKSYDKLKAISEFDNKPCFQFGCNRDIFDFDNVRPYLFPLSSMTEEQKYSFYCRLIENDCGFDDFKEFYLDNGMWIKLFTSLDDVEAIIDWLNKHHFDYRGLIEKGLAIDATGLNIY